MKIFQWQAKDEKVLFFSREYMLHYVVNRLFDIASIIWVGLVVMVLLYMLVDQLASIIFFVIGILCLIYILITFWKNTFIIVTNRRILKYVKDWIFSHHVKELKIYNLQETIANCRWIFDKVFDCGTLSFIGKDEQTEIHFVWIKNPEEIVMYVSRIKDFIVENKDYDYKQLREFVTRKNRKAK